MVRRLRLYVVVAVVLGGLTAGSYAIAAGLGGGRHEPPQSREFKARLNGYQETPAVSSTGSGELRAKLVGPTTLHYVFTYRALEGGTSLFAHVHFGERAVAGGVSFFLCGGGGHPAPCPNVSGTVEDDVTPDDVVGPNGRASSRARSPRSCVRCAPGPRTRTSTRRGGRAARSAARSTTGIRGSSRDRR